MVYGELSYTTFILKSIVQPAADKDKADKNVSIIKVTTDFIEK